MTNDLLEGRVALVTGGGGAIGRAAVDELCALGAEKILVCGRRLALLDEVCQLDPKRIIPVQLDVGSKEDWSRVWTLLDDERQTVDVLVAAAGINRRGPFLDSDPDDWEALWRTNVFGTMLGVSEVLPSMLLQRFGRIILVSSIGARRGMVERVPYAATKGAIDAFARSLASEIGGKGVTVNVLAPGVFVTELTSDWLESHPLIRDAMLSRFPEGRFGRINELHEAFRYLLLSSYAQGTTIDVDGGWAIS
jgi:NAD(P)-dependent dehydrogenase (short-subunit alcohol dehydrogenase family)